MSRPPRVLLIERDVTLGEALSSYLRVAGYDVAHATNLNAAVRILRAGGPVAAVLVDDLTVGPGWLPFVRAAADGAHRILTAFKRQETGSDVAAVLLKPYRASAVVELLSKLGCAPAAVRAKGT